MDTADDDQYWAQDVRLGKTLEEIMISSTTTCTPTPILMEKKITRPPAILEKGLMNCPRCNSTNTKFCYYNNYSLTQPRYFCKACRRYWTEGGCLRNVPVGGGTRKKYKRAPTTSSPSPSSSSSSAANPKKITLPDNSTTPPVSSSSVLPLPSSDQIHHQAGMQYDLNMAFHSTDNIINGNFHNMMCSEFIDQLPAGMMTSENYYHQNSTATSSTTSFSELLRSNSGFSSRGLAASLMPMPVLDQNSEYIPFGFGLNLHDFCRYSSTDLNFPIDHGLVSGYGNNIQELSTDQGGDHDHDHDEKLLFPLEDVKQVPSNIIEFDQQDRGQGDHIASGYWDGML